MMDRKEKVRIIKETFAQHKQKSQEYDTMISHMMKQPYEELEKYLPNEVMDVLKKHRHGGDGSWPESK